LTATNTSRSVVTLLVHPSILELRKSPAVLQMVQYIYGMWMDFSKRRSKGTGVYTVWF